MDLQAEIDAHDHDILHDHECISNLLLHGSLLLEQSNIDLKASFDLIDEFLHNHNNHSTVTIEDSTLDTSELNIPLDQIFNDVHHDDDDDDVIYVETTSCGPHHMETIDLCSPFFDGASYITPPQNIHRANLDNNNTSRQRKRATNTSIVEILNNPSAEMFKPKRQIKETQLKPVLPITDESLTPKRPLKASFEFDCSICLDLLNGATTTICGHVFCKECICKAIKNTQKCPMCNKALKPSDIHRLYLF